MWNAVKVLALSFVSALVFAQGTTSRIVGVITDPSGAAVAGAKVKATNEATNVTFETSASASGNYQFEAIQIGLYRLEVEAAGFKKFVTRNNQLTVGEPMTVNVAMQLGTLNDTIEVTAAAELVQTSTSGNIGPLVNERTMKEMPIVATRRRDPTSILTYVPGMNSGSNTGSGGHMNGARDRAWNFTLDGVDMNETSAGGGVGNNPIRVNPDSVAEMKIVTSNASAEFGRNSGGQVALVTRSGTNELHGNAYWFYRTPRLNANPWQNNFNRVGKEQFVQNIYGGSIGGPIWKNRTFYFANWQELRAIRNITQQATVLTATARQGIYRYSTVGRNTPAGVPNASVDLSGNPIVNVQTYNIFNSDPLRLGADATVKALIDQTPLPNRFDAGDGLNTAAYVFRPTETEKQRDLTAKIDHVINSKNTVYARLYGGFQNTLCDSVNGGLPRVPGAPCLVDTKRTPRNYAFNWRTTPSARLTNEFVGGYSRFAFDFPNPIQDLAKPTFSTSVFTVPVAYTYNNQRTLSTVQFTDNLSYFRGSHAYKFGINFRFTKHLDTRGSVGGQNSGVVVDFDRTLNFVDPAAFGLPAAINQQFDRPALESMINVMLGRVGRISQGFVADGDKYRRGTFDFDSRYGEYDFYVQDTWKIRRNLTLDYGVRVDARTAPRSGNDSPLYVPNQVPVAGGLPSNTLVWQQADRLYKSDWNNFGPTIGLAWDPFSDGKTSIRANYRLAYDRVPTFLISGAVLPNMPGSTLGVTEQTFGAGGGRLRNLPDITPTRKPSELRQPIPFSANNNTVVDPSLETPQTNMWSFGIQREIMKRTVVEVIYIGRRAHNLLGAYDVNQAFVRNNGFLEAFRTVGAGGESALFDRVFSADSRRQANESGAAFARRLYGPQFTAANLGGLASTLARQPQSGTSLPNASGVGPFFFMPYPQFAGGLTVVDSNDFSTFHSLQLNFTRQFARGASVQANYVWAKSLDTRSFDPSLTVLSTANSQSASSTPFDINNRRLNYAPSDFDRRHNFFSNFVYDIPFGKGRQFANNAGPFLNRLIGGWQFSGLFRYSTGRAFTVYAGNTSFNSIVQSLANCNGCSSSFGDVRDEGGFKWYFNPAERGTFPFSATAPNTVAGEQGNTGRNRFYGPRFVNLDASFNKKTQITERFQLELRADINNLTNTPSFNGPTATVTSTLFGRIGADLSSGPRQIMLGAKVNF